MKSMIRMTLASAGLFVMTSSAGNAGVTIDITDTGADTAVTASGTLNLSALTDAIAFLSASRPGLSDFGGALGSSQALVLGEQTVLAFTLRSGPTFVGPSYPFFGAEDPGQIQLNFSSGSGDLISLGYSGTSTGVGIGVADGYVNGAPLAASGTWIGMALSRLSVAAGDSFTWTWGVGDTADFLTINVTAVPEPSAYALLLAGLGLVGLAVRKGKRR
jgi:hypothetical protein